MTRKQRAGLGSLIFWCTVLIYWHTRTATIGATWIGLVGFLFAVLNIIISYLDLVRDEK